MTMYSALTAMKLAEQKIQEALGSFARYVIVSETNKNTIAEKLMKGETVNKEVILMDLVKTNKDLELAIEMGTVDLAEKIVKQEHMGVYEKAAAAEKRAEIAAPNSVVTSVAREVELTAQNGRIETTVTKSEQVKADPGEEEEELEERAAPVSVAPSFTTEQSVQYYHQAVAAGAIKSAPHNYDQAAAKEAIAKMKADNFKNVTINFANNRNAMVVPMMQVAPRDPEQRIAPLGIKPQMFAMAG